MALIRCPECNSEVSDKAHACIRCGFPLGGSEPSSAAGPSAAFAPASEAPPPHPPTGAEHSGAALSYEPQPSAEKAGEAWPRWVAIFPLLLMVPCLIGGIAEGNRLSLFLGVMAPVFAWSIWTNNGKRSVIPRKGEEDQRDLPAQPARSGGCLKPLLWVVGIVVVLVGASLAYTTYIEGKIRPHLIGTWESDQSFSGPELGELNDLLPGLELGGKGRTTFNEDGRYTSTGETFLRWKQGDDAYEMRWSSRESGKWELIGSSLRKRVEKDEAFAPAGYTQVPLLLINSRQVPPSTTIRLPGRSMPASDFLRMFQADAKEEPTDFRIEEIDAQTMKLRMVEQKMDVRWEERKVKP